MLTSIILIIFNAGLGVGVRLNIPTNETFGFGKAEGDGTLNSRDSGSKTFLEFRSKNYAALLPRNSKVGDALTFREDNLPNVICSVPPNKSNSLSLSLGEGRDFFSLITPKGFGSVSFGIKVKKSVDDAVKIFNREDMVITLHATCNGVTINTNINVHVGDKFPLPRISTKIIPSNGTFDGGDPHAYVGSKFTIPETANKSSSSNGIPTNGGEPHAHLGSKFALPEILESGNASNATAVFKKCHHNWTIALSEIKEAIHGDKLKTSLLASAVIVLVMTLLIILYKMKFIPRGFERLQEEKTEPDNPASLNRVVGVNRSEGHSGSASNTQRDDPLELNNM